MPPTIPPARESGHTTSTPVPLYWAAYGPAGAPRLVVLHGGPGAHHDYLLPQMLRLADLGYELLVYDQRGGGRSKTDDRTPITWRTQVEDLALVLRELGVAGPSLVGYSWGGLLALLYAIAAPGGDVGGGDEEGATVARGTASVTGAADTGAVGAVGAVGAAGAARTPPGGPPPAGEDTPARPDPPHRSIADAISTADVIAPAPSRLVLIDPAPATRAYRTQFEAEFARRQAGAEVRALREELSDSGLRERDPDAYRQRQFELGVAGYFADPARARDLTPFRVTGRVQQSIWESLGDFDLLPALGRVRSPALVLHGSHDPIPVESSAGVARALGARFVVIEGAGHVPYVERPEALFGAIAGFLRDTSHLDSR